MRWNENRILFLCIVQLLIIINEQGMVHKKSGVHYTSFPVMALLLLRSYFHHPILSLIAIFFFTLFAAECI